MKMSEADEFLVEGVQRGEASAWREIIDRYQGRLLSFARRMLAQPSDAEDIVQETFLGLMRSLPNYDKSRSLETYLFAILRHKLHDQFRRAPRGQRESLDALGMEDASSSWVTTESPSGHLGGREAVAAQRAALVSALRQYVQQCRDQKRFDELIVVEMLVVLGLRNKEVAADLGMAQTAVAGIKFRVLEAWRKQAESAGKELADFDFSEGELARESTVGQVWHEERISCLKRSTLGGFLLGVLDEDWNEYVDFHVNKAACAECRANLDDLREEESRDAKAHEALKERCFASSVGFLSRPGG